MKMDGLILKRWDLIKLNLLSIYQNLSFEDLNWQVGKEDELIGRLQNKLGKTHEQVLNIINSLHAKTI